jgi:hypothetical protein
VRVFGRPDQIEAFRREATGGGYRSAGAEMA